MVIYLIIFLFSILFINLGYYSNGNKKNIIGKFFIILGLLIPCLLASLRAPTVGSDTSGYITGLYKLVSKSNSFFDYCSLGYAWYGLKDYAYLFITYISAKVFSSFKVLLFLIELLIIVPIYKSLDISKTNKNDVLIGMSVFYLFMYNVTYNMARQSIAIAFSILGLTYVIKNKKISSLICLIFACLFHETAIMTVFVYFAYYFINSKIKKTTKQVFLLLIYIVSLVLVFGYKYIIYFLYSSGIYKHGILYIYIFSKLDFSFMDTFLYIFMLVIIVLNKKVLIQKGINYNFYIFLAIESLIILQLGAFIQYMERVSFYLFYPLLIGGISKINSLDDKISKNTFILLIFLLIYWFFIFSFLKIHNTIPYVLS